jgi:hypothetical protein
LAYGMGNRKSGIGNRVMRGLKYMVILLLTGQKTVNTLFPISYFLFPISAPEGSPHV